MEGEMSSTSKTVSRKKKYRRSYMTCFGVDLSPDNIAVAMVYFVQGVLGLSRLAVSFYLKDDLHLDPAEVCYLYIYDSVCCGGGFCYIITSSSFSSWNNYWPVNCKMVFGSVRCFCFSWTLFVFLHGQEAFVLWIDYLIQSIF